jgi:hypothetical protein
VPSGRRSRATTRSPGHRTRELDRPLDLDTHRAEAFDQQPLVRSSCGKMITLERGLIPMPTAPSSMCATRPLTEVGAGEREPALDDGVGKADLPVELERARMHGERRDVVPGRASRRRCAHEIRCGETTARPGRWVRLPQSGHRYWA